MRIWYQVVSSRKRLPSFLEEVQRQCDAVSSPGVTVEVRGTDHGGNGDQFYSVRHLHGAEMLQMAQREFAADRRHVYAMANCLDPVVDELREVLDAPVITFMEAGCFLASLVGDRIGIVAPNTKMVPRLTSIVEHYGYGRRLVGLGALNCDHIPDFDGMFADPALADPLLAALQEQGERLVGQGADVLLSPGPVACLAARAEIREIAGVPLVDMFAGLERMAEAVGLMAASTGLRTSRAGKYSMPPADAIHEVFGNPVVG